MIVLITGASHTGKTVLAQRLMERHRMPYFSLDHLKMGLIRSGLCPLRPTDEEDALTAFLWPVAREMIKTCLENKQNLIVEGCTIPFDFARDFSPEQLRKIRFYCLAFTPAYIRTHYGDILGHANDIEARLGGDDWTPERLIAANERNLARCRARGYRPVLMDKAYDVSVDLSQESPRGGAG